MHHPRKEKAGQAGNDHYFILPYFSQTEKDGEVKCFQDKVAPVMVDLSPEIRKPFREKEIFKDGIQIIAEKRHPSHTDLEHTNDLDDEEIRNEIITDQAGEIFYFC